MENRIESIEIFKKNLFSLGVLLNEKQINQFIQYYELLIEWNQKINLTAITDFDEVLTKHFLDSLSIIKVIDFSNPVSIIDIGTGAGFPGIPIKIAFPNCQVTLLDSLMKRVNFLNLVIDTLQLSDVKTFHGRAEDYAKPGQLRENFDYCVSRAVANLSTLSELCIPYVKVGGNFIAYKSEKALEEIENSKKSFYLLGVVNSKTISFQLPGSDLTRNLIVLKKMEKTSVKYPRKAGTPAKQPL